MKNFLAKINWNILILVAIIICGAILRFYNLKWDEGYYFHPDERNIAGGVVNLDPAKGDYNPNFFAYGTLPIYLVRIFSGNNYNQAIYVGRQFSAFFSVLIIPLVYLILVELFKKKLPVDSREPKWLPLIGSLLVAFTPGLIQFAHIATFETFLTFEYLVVLWACLKLTNSGRKYYWIISIVLGAAIATKIVSLAIIPVFFFAHFLRVWNNKKWTKFSRKLLHLILSPSFLLALVATVFFTFIFSPYVVLDYASFQGAMNYEGPVARGTLPVFYTQQFKETIPFIYQFLKVFPFILGWPLTILSFVAVIYLIWYLFKNYFQVIFKKKHLKEQQIILVLLTFLGYGILHWYMYVKWTRYMIPLIPLLIIIMIYAFPIMFKKLQKRFPRVALAVFLSLIGFSILLGFNYFTMYLKPDPRILAAKTESKKISNPQEVKLLSEIYDMGIIPWNTSFNAGNIQLFNFYDLDEPISTARLVELRAALAKADYIVLPSNRIYYTKLRLTEKYPLTYQYYTQLFNGDLGFQLVGEYRRTTIYEDLRQKIAPQTIEQKYFPSIFQPDESFHVFDSPTILVFKRTNAK
ncbi:MAG: phospholipid carrier-dependent glycosyltransferase [bacterium]